MELPSELIDEIIGHIPPDDKRSFQNCSLVAKSWRYPSQGRLFEAVWIYPENLRLWLNTISPRSVTLLGHVRFLAYRQRERMTCRGASTGEPVHRALRDHLPSFRQLRYFTLSLAHVASSMPEMELFSAFQHTLSDITFSGCSTTTNALVAIINYFPNLIHLQLYDIDHHKEDEPPIPLARPHLENLYAAQWPAHSLELLEELLKQGLGIDGLVLASIISTHNWTQFAERVVGIFGASLRNLKLFEAPKDNERLTLSHCTEFRELQVSVVHLNDAELNIISSITSINIEKITLSHTAAFLLSVGHTFWTQLDDILIKLIERPKYQRRLEVEFRNTLTRGEQFDPRTYLPKFVERGRLVVRDPKGKLIYCSDEPRERR